MKKSALINHPSLQFLGEQLCQSTEDFTEAYFIAFGRSLDKQLWASLHCGFATCLSVHGYTGKEIDKVIEIGCRLLIERHPEQFKDSDINNLPSFTGRINK